VKSYLTICLLFIFSSCITNKQNDIACNKYKIREDLYKALLKYQQFNPIPIIPNQRPVEPQSPLTAFKYIYEVRYINDDSTIRITLRPGGIMAPDSLIHGVYQDSCLKPTYFVNFSSCDSVKFTNLIREGIDGFKGTRNLIIDILYVQYKYKWVDGSFILVGKIQGNQGE
jgi:hypothetical protein